MWTYLKSLCKEYLESHSTLSEPGGTLTWEWNKISYSVYVHTLLGSHKLWESPDLVLQRKYDQDR